MHRRRMTFIAAGAAAALLGLLVQPNFSRPVATVHPVAGHSITPKQFRLLSGGAEHALLTLGISAASAAGFPEAEVGDEGPAVNPNISPGPPVAGAGVVGGPANVIPGKDGACRVKLGDNIRVNTDCLNATVPTLHGRGQAQNETAIAANPLNPKQIVASQNDYRRGDGACGADFSQDGGRTWGSALAPHGFTAPGLGSNARQYWEAGGDTSVAWDTSGTAYLSCQVFNRGVPTAQDPDQSNALLVFRSGNGGASWTFPGTAAAVHGPQTTFLPLNDKQYIAIDATSTSPFADRIYVSWTDFLPDGTAKIKLVHSSDHGQTFSAPVVVSGASSLCPIAVIGSNSCDANQDSLPFVAPNGDLFVVYDNFNNALSGPTDNHNQVLISRSIDGGVSFSAPVKVSDYYDLPDCPTYTGGQDPGRACVPIKAAPTAATQPSVFRATNYPSAVIDPHDSNHVIVHFGSYINANSKESNGCTPAGLAASGNNLFTGVTTPGACNNDILVSESHNGGTSFTGTTTDPRNAPSVNKAKTATDQFWQWSSILPDGTPAVMFYDRSHGSDETTGFSDISVVRGDDQQRVTTSSMPPPTEFPNAFGHSLFMGDYSGMAAAGKHSVLPFWTDTRDVGVTSCPTDVRKLCSFGNDEDVFVARVGSED